MQSAVRLIFGLIALAILAAGLAAFVSGQPGTGLWGMAVGAIGLVAVAFERTRYRSEAADRRPEPSIGPAGGEEVVPGPPFQRTEETFLDPTTRRRVRVYLDPGTGERRYHAEG